MNVIGKHACKSYRKMKVKEMRMMLCISPIQTKGCPDDGYDLIEEDESGRWYPDIQPCPEDVIMHETAK
jgi:hypothetical protein